MPRTFRHIVKVFNLSLSCFLLLQTFCAPLAYSRSNSSEMSKLEISQMLSKVSSSSEGAINDVNMYWAFVGAAFAVNNKRAVSNPELERQILEYSKLQDDMRKVHFKIDAWEAQADNIFLSDKRWRKYKAEFVDFNNGELRERTNLAARKHTEYLAQRRGLNSDIKKPNFFEDPRLNQLFEQRDVLLSKIQDRERVLLENLGLNSSRQQLETTAATLKDRSLSVFNRERLLRANETIFLELKKQIDILREALPKKAAKGSKAYDIILRLNALEDCAFEFSQTSHNGSTVSSINKVKTALSDLLSIEARAVPASVEKDFLGKLSTRFNKRFTFHAESVSKGMIFLAAIGVVSYLVSRSTDSVTGISTANVLVGRELSRVYNESPNMFLPYVIELGDAFGYNTVSQKLYENQHYLPLLKEQANATVIVRALNHNI